MIPNVLLKNGSPTPLNNIVFLLEVRIKSMSEKEFSVKCVGSLIICSKLTADRSLLLFGLNYLSECRG